LISKHSRDPRQRMFIWREMATYISSTPRANTIGTKPMSLGPSSFYYMHKNAYGTSIHPKSIITCRFWSRLWNYYRDSRHPSGMKRRMQKRTQTFFLQDWFFFESKMTGPESLCFAFLWSSHFFETAVVKKYWEHNDFCAVNFFVAPRKKKFYWKWIEHPSQEFFFLETWKVVSPKTFFFLQDW